MRLLSGCNKRAAVAGGPRDGQTQTSDDRRAGRGGLRSEAENTERRPPLGEGWRQRGRVTHAQGLLGGRRNGRRALRGDAAVLVAVGLGLDGRSSDGGAVARTDR